MLKIFLKYSFFSQRNFYFLFTFCIASFAFSQKEAYNWYFGINAGITFKTTPPTALTDGPINTLEGCATISDSKGDLLFSTDGSNVYSKNQNLMSNGTGLYGDVSSSQSGIVVKKPNSKNIYYIFTVNGFTSSSKGYYYSTIDITKNGGLGEVIRKNDSLIYSTKSQAECITSTFHSNRRDVWVICYNSIKQEFASFLVTPSGVNTTPVTSSFSHNGRFYYGKASPNGAKYAVGSGNEFILADFNTTTGKLTNINSLNVGYCYGIEFSPNSNLLYTGSSKSIFQFDITLSTLSLITGSKTIIATGSFLYGLQLGPDKQIWVSHFDTALSVIPYPNIKGTSCQFYFKYLGLHKKKSQLGLPSFFQSYFDPDFNYSGQCFGDTAWFSITDTASVDSVIWNFGDPASAFNISKGYKVFHLFSDTGDFIVQSYAYNDSLIDTTIHLINQVLYLGRTFELGNEIYKCFDDTITLGLSASTHALRVKWNTGSDSLFTKVIDSGYYSVKKYYGAKCYNDDSVRIIFYKNNLLHGKISLGKDLYKCPYDSLKLRFYDSNSSKYIWSNGTINAPLVVKQPGTYYINAYYGGSCYRTDTINIDNYTLPKYTLGHDTFYCPNQSIWLGYFEEGFNSYLWSTGSNSAFLIPDSSGKYSLEIKDSNGCKQSDTINVSALTTPKVNLGNDTSYCDISNYLTLDAKNKSKFSNFKWFSGHTTQTDTVNKSGKYWVTVTNPCGKKADTISLKFFLKPKVNLPPDSVFCNTVNIVLDAENANNGATYNWNTNEKTQTITISDTGMYEVIVQNKCGKDSDQMKILKYLSPQTYLGNDTIFCNAFNIKLKIGKKANGETYDWIELKDEIGIATKDTIIWSNPGIIVATITNKCGVSKDTIIINQFHIPKLKLDSLYEFCETINFSPDVTYLNNNETYLWNTNQTTPKINIAKAGKYWVKTKNYCGTDSLNFKVELYQKPLFDLGNDTNYCGTLNRILDATINDSKAKYQWLSGETIPILNATNTGKYKVTVTNFCGSASDSIKLGFYKTPSPNIGPNSVFCDTMPPTLRSIKAANLNDIYLWSNGDTDTSTTFINAGKHWVKIASPCGVVSDTVIFSISQSPKVYLGLDTSLCGNFELQLDAANPGMNYKWSPFGETTQSIIAKEQTTYKVLVTNFDGCSGKGELTINGNCISKYWFPNSFTPNTDQLNETFKPVLINFENYEMKIFNRWGELIFETNNVEKGWDGTYKNSYCEAGVYFYISNFISTENNNKNIIKGTITLLK